MSKHTYQHQFLGVKPDRVDDRDLVSSRGLRAMFGMLPAKFSHTDIAMPYIFDQESEGSCVGNAVSMSAFIQCELKRDAATYMPFSRRWIMLNASALDEWPETSSTGEDGTSIRAAMKAGNHNGFCFESTLPYKAGERQVVLTPHLRAIIDQETALWRIKVYRSLMYRQKVSMSLLKQSVMRDGSACVAMYLPEEFFGATKDTVIHGGALSQGMHALHALVVTGWDRNKDGQEVIEIVNSWGTSWGNSGVTLWDARSFIDSCQCAWSFELL